LEVFDDSVDEHGATNENVGTKCKKEKLLVIRKFCVDLVEKKKELNLRV